MWLSSLHGLHLRQKNIQHALDIVAWQNLFQKMAKVETLYFDGLLIRLKYSYGILLQFRLSTVLPIRFYIVSTVTSSKPRGFARQLQPSTINRLGPSRTTVRSYVVEADLRRRSYIRNLKITFSRYQIHENHQIYTYKKNINGTVYRTWHGWKKYKRKELFARFYFKNVKTRRGYRTGVFLLFINFILDSYILWGSTSSDGKGSLS